MSSLHICTSDSWGGLELYAATLMIRIRHAGRRVVVLCRPGSKLESFLKEHDVECLALPGRSKISLSSIRFLRGVLEREKISTVHVHFHADIWNASIALRNDDTRKLYLSIYMGVGRKNDPLHRWVYRRVDAIFTSSKELNDRLPSLYPVPKQKIHFLPYGRDLDLYTTDAAKRESVRRSLGVRPDDILVGTMVRIDPGKGALDFAKSILYLDERFAQRVRYLIVGEPTRKARKREGESPFEKHCEEYLSSIQAFIESETLGGRLFLQGFQPDLVGYLSAFDIFVFPSRDEMYSLVVLDAMCMGLPVVAARAGGTIWQIEDGSSGLLYEVGNSADLASKLNQYLGDPDLRARHGASAKAFVVERHSMKDTVQQLLWWYDKR